MFERSITIIFSADKQQAPEDGTRVDDDYTQDPAEDEQQLGRVKDWVITYHLDTIELNDVLSKFPDISVVLIEEIMDNLVKEGILSKTGTDCYTINKPKKFDYEFDAVKEEMDGLVVPVGNKGQQNVGEDHVYMRALYHALPMNYVTVAKLQSKLEGEANQTTVRKLIDKMTREGFVEAKSIRRLGKRVIHSDLTEKKLSEVKKALDIDAMDVDVNGAHNRSKDAEFQTGSNHRDLSTCGVLHSIGSDLTRTRGRSDTYQNGSIRSEHTVLRMRESGHNTPTSKAQPIASIESYTEAGAENARSNGNTNHCDEFDNFVCSRSTQEKRSRKASTVKEPILQYIKRQKSQAP